MTESLLEELKIRIAAAGPLPVADYMALALAHPRWGYYMARDPLGAAGDFITASEVSQMFGELIGLWLADRWQALGRPGGAQLVELGPGRGTLMADLLRATAAVPGFPTVEDLHLVETSPALRERQKARLGDAPTWHDTLDTVPDGPIFLIANEFFDALPIHQFIRTAAGWRERKIGLSDDGTLCFVAPGPDLNLADIEGAGASSNAHRQGAIIETSPASIAVAQEIARRIAAHGGAALIIDYGYEGPATGDTFQAVRAHKFADPLAEPGMADLTAHVDFAAIAAAAGEHADIRGPVGQGDFLLTIGLRARAAQLAARADERQKHDIETACERLTAPQAMGTLFKVMALTPTGTGPVPGFI